MPRAAKMGEMVAGGGSGAGATKGVAMAGSSRGSVSPAGIRFASVTSTGCAPASSPVHTRYGLPCTVWLPTSSSGAAAETSRPGRSATNTFKLSTG